MQTSAACFVISSGCQTRSCCLHQFPQQAAARQISCAPNSIRSVKRAPHSAYLKACASRQRRRLSPELARAQAGDGQHYLASCAEELVTKHVKNGAVVGLGTGVLVNALIAVLAEKTASGQLQGVKCIPASDIAASEAAFQGVTVTSLKEYPQVGVTFEEVDEIVLLEDGLPFIAGRYAEPVQPNLLRMRALLSASKHNIALVDGMDNTTAKLRGILPVVVDADIWEDTGEALDDIFIPDAEVWRRTTGGYDPNDPRAMSNPYMSPQGHNILDVKFDGPLKLFGENASYDTIAEEVQKVDGVISHGLFVNVAHAAAMLTEEGVQWFESSIVGVTNRLSG